jgi:hypothetical protein
MPTTNTQIQTLTTNNSISEMMLKINELVYELNSFYHGQFDYLPTPTANTEWLEGRVFYDLDSHSLSYYNDVPGIVVNLGQELLLRTVNNTANSISVGQVVYVTGSSNKIPTIELALSNSYPLTEKIIGLANHDIPASGNGYITLIGYVDGVNTSSYNAGDVLYLSPTIAGGITNVKPISNNQPIIKIGTVAYSDSTAGKIFVEVSKQKWQVDDIDGIHETIGQAIANNMNSFITLTDPVLDDILIHDGSVFINKPKQTLTDGGNF